jgi:predicted alpha/beta superfamily hydrolase
MACAAFILPQAQTHAQIHPELEQADNGRLEVLTFADPVFNRSRNLRVWLPAGYNPLTTAYPVLYLFDGQNLFDASLSHISGAEWQVDETAQALIHAGKMTPIIVVGIDNAPGFGRAEEYLPWPDHSFPNPEQRPVLGNMLPDFLRHGVIPFIEARYSVDARKRGLGGSSYGGLASLYVALKAPELFSRLLVESPSLHVAHKRLLQEIAEQKNPSWPSLVSIGMGEREASGTPCQPTPSAFDETLIRATRELQRLLENQGLGEKRLKVVLEPCATHNERAWAGRLSDALSFLYASNLPVSNLPVFGTTSKK